MIEITVFNAQFGVAKSHRVEVSRLVAPRFLTLGRHMAFYEHVVVTRPDISPAQVDTFVEELSEFVASKGGAVKKTEYWGLRNLAYPIQKVRKGHYSLLNLDAPADAVQELERRHRITDEVMRYMTVRVEELEEGPSPILSRKDRGERSDRKRD